MLQFSCQPFPRLSLAESARFYIDWRGNHSPPLILPARWATGGPARFPFALPRPLLPHHGG
eukprot:4125714-Pyramimonas_sp.AAC.1